MFSSNFLKFVNLFKFNNIVSAFILICLIYQTRSKKEKFSHKLISFGNEITIKINNKGEHYFFYINLRNAIQKIYIKNEEKEYNKDTNKIILESGDNIIRIVLDLDQINSLDFMFSECENVTEIDLSNFNSTRANGIYKMFYNCISLTSINFKNFDTSKVTNMQEMFKNCRNLKSLDLSNFNTSLIQNMYEMFSGCKNLITLNLSNFNLSKTYKTQNLLFDCNNLEILDLSNLIISEETNLNSLSSNLPKLKYINFKMACISNIN